MVMVAIVLTATMPVVLCVVRREGWGGNIFFRGFRRPSTLFVTWSFCCVTSICSMLFLVQVTAWLEAGRMGETDPFMGPLLVLLSYGECSLVFLDLSNFCCARAWVSSKNGDCICLSGQGLSG